MATGMGHAAQADPLPARWIDIGLAREIASQAALEVAERQAGMPMMPGSEFGGIPRPRRYPPSTQSRAVQIVVDGG